MGYSFRYSSIRLEIILRIEHLSKRVNFMMGDGKRLELN